MLSTIVFEPRKPHKVSNLAIVPQAPESRSRREASFFETLSIGPEPNLLRHSAVCQILFGMVILPLDVLPVFQNADGVAKKEIPKCHQIQPLSFLGSFTCLCVSVRLNRNLYHSGDFYHFPPVAAGLVPIMGASSAHYVCV